MYIIIPYVHVFFFFAKTFLFTFNDTKKEIFFKLNELFIQLIIYSMILQIAICEKTYGTFFL